MFHGIVVPPANLLGDADHCYWNHTKDRINGDDVLSRLLQTDQHGADHPVLCATSEKLR